MSPRSTCIVTRSTAVRAPKRFVSSSVCSAVSGISEAYFHQQRPVVHATDCCITQNRNTPNLIKIRWSKDVVDAAVVDCRVTRSASQVAKAAQDVAVRFTVVFQVVGVEIRFVGRFELEVKITGNENGSRLRALLCPIDQLLCVRATARGIEGIGVSTQEHNLRRVAARSE